MEKCYKASCLCGVVSLTVGGFSNKVAHCHCTMCRKFHGAAFATLVSVSGLSWQSGFDNIKEFSAENGTIRSFCNTCGSSLGFRVKGSDISGIELAIAIFDENIPVQPDAHIYTNYRANWCELSDGVKTFSEGRI